MGLIMDVPEKKPRNPCGHRKEREPLMGEVQDLISGTVGKNGGHSRGPNLLRHFVVTLLSPLELACKVN
jgi:hypothetical protein